MKKLLGEAYAAAKELLIANRSLLDEIAEYLLLKESITGEELMAFLQPKEEPKEEAPSEEITE